MKLKNKIQIEAFNKAIEKAKGDVWLESTQGDRFNLKSNLSHYVAIGELLKQRFDELELFCSLPEDEAYFLGFFYHYPETI